MKIHRCVLQRIFAEQRDYFPESGGILGGTNGIVSRYYLDEGTQDGPKCSYSPNVELLNAVIDEWQNENIDFMGIYHTHFFGVESLSEGDIQYIKQIMQSMPDEITSLYFPILKYPEKQMISYIAKNEKGNITIAKNPVSIVD